MRVRYRVSYLMTPPCPVASYLAHDDWLTRPTLATQDRLDSYHEGRAPKLWPSFDAIRFYPKKFDNFPHLMDAYIKKLPPGHPMIASRVTANGVPVLSSHVPPGHTHTLTKTLCSS